MAKNTTIPMHAFPGNLKDMTSVDDQKEWSQSYVSGWMSSEIAGGGPGPNGTKRTPLTQYFDGTQTPFNPQQQPTTITWTAFPARVSKFMSSSTPLRWQIADSARIYQDEYCEWSVSRPGDPLDSSKPILNCVFTCEGPEYWQYYASRHPDQILAKYQELNPQAASQMSVSDFFLDANNTAYNPLNYWNLTSSTGTIMHLTHPANTLGAEIDISAQATIIRKDKAGKIVTNFNQLINCSQYGDQWRNSDPNIGGSINEVARGGNSITIADPVGLYFNSFNTTSFQLDYSGNADGSMLEKVPDGVFVFTPGRGDITKGQGLRLSISIPKGIIGKTNKRQLNVSDIYDNNNNVFITYAAQFADYILMGVSARTIPVTAAAPQACPAGPDKAAAVTTTALAAESNGTNGELIEDISSVKALRHPKIAFRR